MIDHKAIFDFLEEDLGVDTSDLQNDTLLFSTGIIDSFALVTLMMFLENEGGYRINPADVNLDNLDSVDRIVAFSQRVQA